MGMWWTDKCWDDMFTVNCRILCGCKIQSFQQDVLCCDYGSGLNLFLEKRGAINHRRPLHWEPKSRWMFCVWLCRWLWPLDCGFEPVPVCVCVSTQGCALVCGPCVESTLCVFSSRGRSWVALSSTCIVYLQVNFHTWTVTGQCNAA